MLAMALLMISAGAYAQEKNVIGIAPFKLGNGLKLKYETTLTEKITVGGIGTYFYGGWFTGLQVAPMGRYYFKNALQGFYGQGTAVVGFQKRNEKEWPDMDFNVVNNKSGLNLGVGMAIGYQKFIGKRFTFDLNAGFRPILKYPDNWGKGTKESFDEKNNFDALLSIGYRF